MRTPLVLHNLLHQRWRTLVAVAGVAFVVTLVFMQLGFYRSAEAAATPLLDRLDFDLILTAAEYQDLNRPCPSPAAASTRRWATRPSPAPPRCTWAPTSGWCAAPR